jgi:hypothetical protein
MSLSNAHLVGNVVDAVNILKGDLNNLGLGIHHRHKSIILMPKSSPYGLCGTVSSANRVNEPFKFICTVDEFNACVDELSEGIFATKPVNIIESNKHAN